MSGISGESVVTGLIADDTYKQKDSPQFLVLQERQEGETFSMRFFTENTDYQCYSADREKAVKFAEKAHALASVSIDCRQTTAFGVTDGLLLDVHGLVV